MLSSRLPRGYFPLSYCCYVPSDECGSGKKVFLESWNAESTGEDWRYVLQPVYLITPSLSLFICSTWSIISISSTAVCVNQCQFHDKYFDNPKFALTLRDMWLRERQGCWELKCPTTDKRVKTNVAAELCTRYHEITDLSEIQMRVKEVITDCEDGERSSSLQDEESWLKKLNLLCFAEFTTTRQSFVLQEEGVHVDLDQADFGYSVGEIEVLVPEGGDMNSALEKIERTAQKLGGFPKLHYSFKKKSMLCLCCNRWKSFMRSLYRFSSESAD